MGEKIWAVSRSKGLVRISIFAVIASVARVLAKLNTRLSQLKFDILLFPPTNCSNFCNPKANTLPAQVLLSLGTLEFSDDHSAGKPRPSVVHLNMGNHFQTIWGETDWGGTESKLVYRICSFTWGVCASQPF